MINRSNYEIYLIDLLDGKLSEAKSRELMLFLAENPDLKEEFDGIEETILIPADVKFTSKTSLKKPDIISENNLSELLIADLENDLNDRESKELKIFLKTRPELEKEKGLFAKTFLKPDESIIFENKNKLKKSENKVRPLYYYISAAAALLFIFFIKGFFDVPNIPIAQMHRENTDPAIISNKKETIIKPAKDSFQLSYSGKSPNVDHRKKGGSEKNISHEYAATEKNKLVTPLNDSIQQDVIAFVPNEKIDSIQTGKKDSPAEAIVEVNSKTLEKVRTVLANGNEIVTPANCSPEIKNKKFDFANAFVKLTNKLTGKKIKIKREYNCEGEVVQYAFASENFEYSKKK